MLEFAERLTRAPWSSGPDDIAELRRHGFGDRDIHDIVQVAAYFNYINRVADGLGVEPEAFMEPWEHRRPTTDGVQTQDVASLCR
jgi:alkylhydroperoxidase family enzyme